VNALRNVHRMLAPQGLVLDLHPVPPNARVLVDGVDVGPVHEEEFFRRDLRPAERELRRAVREGLFEPLREMRFRVDSRYDDPGDLLSDLDDDDWGCLSARVRKRVAQAPGPVVLREPVLLQSFRAR
jgi:hypothetical protein